MNSTIVFAASALIVAAVNWSTRVEAAEKVDFQHDIRPLLSNRCFKCHGPAKHEGDLRLDDRDLAVKLKAILPGDPSGSKLLRRVTDAGDERMPPADAGERLSAAEVAKLRAWITQGAEYTPHWSLVAPRPAPPPNVRDADWPLNPIDRFVLARLEKERIKPSPPADRTTLIRRVYLDLLGLPPDPRDVAEFLADTRPDAYEQLVEKLLQSPHYGERQARHWLDLARYADSNGYTIDGQRMIWPYRDWVIGAFNRDLPFDQFTIQQLAGDLLPQPTREQLIATGFHRNTPFNEEGGTDQEQFRVERTVDRTNVTGTVWLGLTVGCAQCHDHKFDPLKQKEYYQLYGFLNSIDERPLSLASEQQQRRLKQLNDQLAEAKQEKTKPAPDVNEVIDALEKEAAGGWTVLEPVKLDSASGSKLSRLDDRSVLAGGPLPDSDVYTIEARVPAPEADDASAANSGEIAVTAVRLEALTHPSLPKNGPGRAGNGNFVLSSIDVRVFDKLFVFHRAVADHSQKNYDVNNVLLAAPDKGWAINGDSAEQRNSDHQAVFVCDKPVQIKPGDHWIITLHSCEAPKKYLLGHFRLSFTTASERFATLSAHSQKLLLTPPAERTDDDTKQLRERLSAEISLDEKTAAAGMVERIKAAQKAVKDFETSLPTTLITREVSKPRETHVHIRGDFLAKGDIVSPGAFACLPPLAIDDRPATRLDLARWLTAPENPLTARVTINRVWQQYFGKGIVETENDFGFQGAVPTHPELLDWLALEFQRQNWSMKAMHRLIVTSATYRQSSNSRPDPNEKDANNKLLARQFRLRLEGEIIRDAALTASGLLSRKVGGPGVFPPQPPEVFSFTQSRRAWVESKGPDRYRRGMYTYIWRQSQHPLLTTFDGADAQTACTRRNRSDTPLQALHLANDVAFWEIAEGLTKRLEREATSDDAARIELAFRLCMARAPSVAEQVRLQQYLDQQRQQRPDAAWTMLARALLNLDEFITRE